LLLAAGLLCCATSGADSGGSHRTRARQHSDSASPEPDVCRALADLATRSRLDLLRVDGEPAALSDFENGQLAASPFTVALDPFSLPLGRGGEPVRLVGIESRDQCASRLIRSVDEVLPSRTGDIAHRWSALASAEPGNADYPIRFRQQYFLVTAERGDANRAQRISRILPDGSMEPLCRLRQSTPALTVRDAAAPALCRAVADGKAPRFAWEAWTPPENSDSTHPTFGSRYGADADGTEWGLLRVLPGPAVPVGRFHAVPNPSSCGVQATYWLEQLTPAGDRSVPSPLHGSGATDVYQFHGRSYVYLRDADGPQLVDYTTPTPTPLCQFGETSETRVDSELAAGGQTDP